MNEGVIGVFSVYYLHHKNCFVYLHSKWLKKMNGSNDVVCVIIKINDGPNFLASCNSVPHDYHGENAVGLNATFANLLNISEDTPVILFNSNKVVTARTVSIKPISVYDREILESEFLTIQNSLLNQIRVVNVRQKLPIWISNGVVVHVYVYDIDNGCSSAKLAEYTEINVLYDVIEGGFLQESENNPDTDVSGRGEIVSNNVGRSSYSFLALVKSQYWAKYFDMKYYVGLFSSLLLNDEGTALQPLYSLQPVRDVFSVLPLVWLEHFCNIYFLQPYDIIVSKTHLNNIGAFIPKERKKNYLVCELEFVQFSDNETRINVLTDLRQAIFCNGGSDDRSGDAAIFVRVFTIEDILSGADIGTEKNRDDFLKYTFSCRSMFVSSFILNYFEAAVGSKAYLRLVYDHVVDTQKVHKIELLPALKMSNEDKNTAISAFENLLAESSLIRPIFLNNRNLYSVTHENKCFIFFVQFFPSSLSFAHVNSSDLNSLQSPLQWKDHKHFEKYLKYRDCKYHCENSFDLLLFRYVEGVLKEQVISARLNLFGLDADYDYLFNGFNHLIIEGDVGTGKTSVVDLLDLYFQKKKIYAHFKKLRCKILKGKNIGKLEKILNSVISECIYYEPSVLVLDDIDALVPISRTEDPHNLKYRQRLLNLMYDAFRPVSAYKILIIATATSTSHLCGTYLFDTRAKSLFTHKIQLPNLNQGNRSDMLKFLVLEKFRLSPEINNSFIDELINKMEGYCIQDMVDFKNKLCFQIFKNRGAVQLTEINRTDVENAFKQVSPIAWAGVDLYKSTDVKWSNVGGLDDVKKLLTEIIIWPSLYPDVFEQCPLKVQSGILLYGFPGSGKTLIAAAIAGECNINFISVKGPELLSKYTGSSEQKVRETFQKADSAKPCILFFDEFESLAARRGNDVTGVTDRVVNQLLTEMDGIESRSGVWILAASSRPDLIDPALLRPGRLGSKVYCRLPNKEDRLAILKVLSSSYRLMDDADLTDIAEITENYTGADLQSVLYTAYAYNLSNVSVSSSLYSENSPVNHHSKGNMEYIKISNEQLRRAVAETKPSLTDMERRKFEYIYESFSGNRRQNIISQKITFA